MTTLNELLEDFQGLRNDVATAIADRYDSVADLANTSVGRLTEIKGIGATTAERLIATAEDATTKPTAASRPAPTPPAEDSQDALLDRVAAFLGSTIGFGVGLLRSLQRRLTS